MTIKITETRTIELENHFTFIPNSCLFEATEIGTGTKFYKSFKELFPCLSEVLINEYENFTWILHQFSEGNIAYIDRHLGNYQDINNPSIVTLIDDYAKYLFFQINKEITSKPGYRDISITYKEIE